MKTTDKLIKAVEKFNNDLREFGNRSGEDGLVTLYEDAYTTRVVADFKLYKNGVLTWKEMEDGNVRTERYDHYDDDDIRDTMNFWRANLRRAKRYWEMDTEKLDAIQDPENETEDEE